MIELAGPFFMSAVLLVTSGATKVLHPGGIARALYSLGVPATYTTGRLIGGVEIAVGAAALAFGGRYSATAVCLLYLAFSGFIAIALRSEKVRTCGCFGDKDSPPSVLHLVIDLSATAVAAVLVFRPIGDIVTVMSDTPGAGIPLLILVVIGARLAAMALTLLPALAAEAGA